MPMTKTLMIVAETAVLNWALILAAAMLKSRGWSPAGMKTMLGNREGLAAPTGVADRAERAARNMLENLVLFTALALVASVGGVTDPYVELGARLFFWARVVYIPIYLVGIPVARTAAWALSIVGMGMMLATIARAAPGF
jgi:uncharacterized MAPEG superfamily protein